MGGSASSEAMENNMAKLKLNFDNGVGIVIIPQTPGIDDSQRTYADEQAGPVSQDFFIT